MGIKPGSAPCKACTLPLYYLLANAAKSFSQQEATLLEKTVFLLLLSFSFSVSKPSLHFGTFLFLVFFVYSPISHTWEKHVTKIHTHALHSGFSERLEQRSSGTHRNGRLGCASSLRTTFDPWRILGLELSLLPQTATGRKSEVGFEQRKRNLKATHTSKLQINSKLIFGNFYL